MKSLPQSTSSTAPSSEGAGKAVTTNKKLILTKEINMKTYNKSNIPLAKTLRKNPTPWERKLWFNFLRSYSIRFQRQKAIGEYIVDFYCAKAGLIIELDGGGHYKSEQAEKDRIRSEKLMEAGLTVLRFTNTDIDRNFNGVCEVIDKKVKENYRRVLLKDKIKRNYFDGENRTK